MNLTLAQKIHLLVGIVSFVTWIGLLVASRFVGDGAGFLATFADVITLAKGTTVSAVAIATAVGNFTNIPSDQPTALPPNQPQ